METTFQSWIDGQQPHSASKSHIATLQQSNRVFDVSKQVYELEPTATPFMTFTMNAIKGKPRTVSNPLFYFTEKYHRNFTLKATEAINDSATSLTVDDIGSIVVGNYILNTETDEVVKITNIATTTGPTVHTLTIARGELGSSAASISDEDTFCRLTDNLEDGGEGILGKFTGETLDYNFIEVTKTLWEISELAKASGVNWGKGNKVEMLADKLREHKMEMERKALFGFRHQETDGTTGRKRYTMGGFERFVDSGNIFTPDAGILSKKVADGLMEQIFAYGSRKKLMLAGGTILHCINNWYDTRVVNDNTIPKKLGQNIREYETPYGILQIVYGESMFYTIPRLSGTAFIIDVGNCRPVQMSGLTGTKSVIFDPGKADLEQGEFRTYMSYEFLLPKTHAIIKGVTDYEAD